MFQGSGDLGLKVCRVWGTAYVDKPKAGEISSMSWLANGSLCWATPEGHLESRRHQKVLRECGICLAGVSLALVPVVSIVNFKLISIYVMSGQVCHVRSGLFLLLHGYYWISWCTQPTPSRDLATLVAARVVIWRGFDKMKQSTPTVTAIQNALLRSSKWVLPWETMRRPETPARCFLGGLLL